MKRFFLGLLFISTLVYFGCSSRSPTPTPIPVPVPIPTPIPTPEPTPTPEPEPTPTPEPEPDPIVKITWDQDGTGDCVDHWVIKTSNQDDLSLEDQWIEVGTTDQLPTEDNPYIMPEQAQPYYVTVYAVCTNGSVSEPSDVLEIV